MVQIIRQEHEPVKSFVSCVKRFPLHENERFYVSREPCQLNRTVVRLSVGFIEVELLQTSCPLHPAMPSLRIPKSCRLHPAKPILAERMIAGKERERLDDLIPVVELLLSNTQIHEKCQKVQKKQINRTRHTSISTHSHTYDTMWQADTSPTCRGRNSTRG